MNFLNQGSSILHIPLLNKGTAFTQKERDLFGLHGLLPSHISTVQEQKERCYYNFTHQKTPLEKYIYLNSILNRNEQLFYQFVSDHAAEMLPYLYTPTVGEASMQYSLIYAQQRGLYISYALEEKIEEMVANIPQKEIDILVVTDGERILGLGDQGLGGMAIPVGKLALYTLFAGIHPSRTLPVLLDVGTNNPELLGNPFYLGLRQERIRGADYDRFVDRFIRAIHRRYPNALLQWEDFGKINARTLLERYRTKLLSFNDDIQGTAAVTLAAIVAALNESNAPLKDQRIALLGGGSAGIGIAEMIVQALVEEGLSLEAARRKIFIVDMHGLIHFNSAQVTEEQRPFMHPHETFQHWDIVNFDHISLFEVITNAKPTILIGVSAQPRAFTQEMIEEMARYTRRPIVLPLSNPTSKAECTPQELIEWTGGRAIIATGSPFQPVSYQDRTYAIAQCNNVYIFPGVGLGALVAEAKEVSSGMFLEATRTLAAHSPALCDATAALFPQIGDVRRVSREIALRVALKAVEEGLSTLSAERIEANLARMIWEPRYSDYTMPNAAS